MQADVKNLVPVIGTMNAAHADHPFGLILGELRQYGACDFEKKGNLIEPRPEIRKTIAEIYFYMEKRYPDFNIVNNQNKKLLQNWNDGSGNCRLMFPCNHKSERLQGVLALVFKVQGGLYQELINWVLPHGLTTGQILNH